MKPVFKNVLQNSFILLDVNFIYNIKKIVIMLHYIVVVFQASFCKFLVACTYKH